MSCKNNCGFHGNNDFNGYCSKCFKSLSLKSSETEKNVKTVDLSLVKEKDPKPINRCLTCRKKVGIYGFLCKCEGYYCTVHRYPETHECLFDYKNEGKMKIIKDNPIIKAAKIHKI